ncbi:MAG TPA: hypothetical protein VHP33_24890 [Polyangiaceae bacterium]|nr:hypothetical protein [Polyangiaceae bacterium]
MKSPLLVPSLVALLLGSAVVSMPGCNSSSSSGDPTAGGSDNAASGGDGAGGVPDSSGGTASTGPTNGGATGDAGSTGNGEAGGSNTPAGALSTTTFLYVHSVTPDADELVAVDYATGEQWVVTDQKGDDSDGWEIRGHAISPDRTRIAIASLYGPTKADNATGLATRRIWTLAADGSDFQRLTPVFDNDGGGRKNYSLEVESPVYSLDGTRIIYDFGSWWYEGTTLEGGSFPWSVTTTGNDLPEPFPTITSCTVIEPSVNPATGDVLLVHSVCIKSDDEGIFLYPKDGGTEPVKLIDRGYGAGAVDPALTRASWLADGSGFVFVGGIEVTRGETTATANSLLAYDMETGDISVLVIPDAETHIRSAAIAPNGDGIVYCLAHDDLLDLHAVDFTVDPPVDSAITDDGISCSPVF